MWWLVAAGSCRYAQPVRRVVVPNPTLGPMTIAVAPALNLSGSSDFDPNRFADLMASELSHADRISVIPVSRVLGALASQRKDRVESPEHALSLAEVLGADAILVFAVTEYDPYDPPIIGLSAQLYGTKPQSGGGSVDPMVLSRRASFRGPGPRTGPRRLLAETQAVFDASHNAVAEEIKQFAAQRRNDGGPFGWRKTVVDQQQFIRFCCYRTIVKLFQGRPAPVPSAEARKKVGRP